MMNGTGDDSQAESGEELEALVERAVKAVLAEPSPKHARQRVIDAAASWTPDSVKERSRRRMQPLAAVAVAAALLVAVCVGLYLAAITGDTRETARTDRTTTDQADRPAPQHRETLVAPWKNEVTKDRVEEPEPGRGATDSHVPGPTETQLSFQPNRGAPGVERIDAKRFPFGPESVQLKRQSKEFEPSYLMTVVAESAPVMLANGRGESIPLGARLPKLGRGEGSVHVWDWSQSPRSRVLKDVEFLTVNAALSPCGKWLVKANGDVFDLETGQRKRIDLGAGVRVEGRWDEGVNDVRFSPDGGRLAVLIGSPTDEGAHDTTARRPPCGEVRIVEFPSGKRLCEFPAGEPYKLRIGFSPDGKQVVTGDPARQILRRDATTGEIIKLYEPAFDEQVFSTAISPDGRFVAATQRGGDLLVWEADTGRLAHRQHGRGERIGVDCLRFSPDSRLLAAAHWTADWTRLTVYDAATGRVVGEIKPRRWFPLPTVVQWSADGKELTVVSGGPAVTSDGRDVYPSVRKWDWRSGKLLRSLDASASAEVPSSDSQDQGRFVP